MNIILNCLLIRTTKRLTFDIVYQSPLVTYQGDDDGPYFKFVATNGYEVISRSRMDIQTERLWLKGGATDETSFRSGTMIFRDNSKRDRCYLHFKQALFEWANHNKGIVILNGVIMKPSNFELLEDEYADI